MKKVTMTMFLVLALSLHLLAQQKTVSVTGTVTTSSGDPLSGVTVIIDGKTAGVLTNQKGVYTIPKVEADGQLIFSFIGMESQKIKIAGRTKIDIVLQEALNKMEDVVVVGYGSQRKSDLTGSVASISSKDMEAMNATTVDNLLQGMVAGVRVSANSGAPGAGLNIQIRGINSINGSNEPLYVVDGFPIEVSSSDVASDPFADSNGQYSNVLAGLNARDIESIEILKDASATAIYGSKGANGVVLITTKKGGSEAQGRDLIEVSYSLSLDRIARNIPMLEPWEWATMYNQSVRQSGSASHLFDGTYSKNGIYWPTVDDIRYQQNTLYGNWGVNWADEVFQLALTHDVNLSARGNGKTSSYAVTLNALDNEGIVPNTKFSRYNGKVSLTKQIGKMVRLSANSQVSRSGGQQKTTAGNTTNNEGVVINSLRYNNVFPAYHNGKPFNIMDTDEEADMSVNHPLVAIYDSKNEIKTLTSITSGAVDITPLKGLTIRSTLNLKTNSSERDVYFPRTTYQGSLASGSASNAEANNLVFVNENTVNYKFALGGHKFDVLGGYSFEEVNSRTVVLRVKDFFSDDLLGMNMSDGADPQTIINTIKKTRMISGYGRINYNYKDRYLATVTMRADGSSKFGANHKWGYFPSFSVAWRVNQEKFMRHVNWISNLKIRGGYGQTGSQAIDAYESLRTMDTNGYYFGSSYVKGVYIGSLGNDLLSWETTEQLDLGVDFGMFNNRLNLTLDYYDKRTNDLLQSVNLPYEIGFGSTTRNTGTVRNRGLEVALQGAFRIGQVQWTSTLNYSMNRNKVLSLGDCGQDYILGPELIAGENNGLNSHITKAGHPISSYYGYLSDGIIQTQAQADAVSSSINTREPGEVNFLDVSGPNGAPDGVIDSYDRVILGSPYPDFEMNFNNRLSWRGWSFSFNISGSYGNQVLNYNLIKLEAGNMNKVESARMRGAWTIYNGSNTQPKVSGLIRQKVISDRLIEDASFIKLRNVTLSYTLKLKKKTFLNSAQFFAKGSNLLTLTRYTGYDPEVNEYQTARKPGVDNGSYPSTRTYTFGVSLVFN